MKNKKTIASILSAATILSMCVAPIGTLAKSKGSSQSVVSGAVNWVKTHVWQSAATATGIAATVVLTILWKNHRANSAPDADEQQPAPVADGAAVVNAGQQPGAAPAAVVNAGQQSAPKSTTDTNVEQKENDASAPESTAGAPESTADTHVEQKGNDASAPESTAGATC